MDDGEPWGGDHPSGAARRRDKVDAGKGPEAGRVAQLPRYVLYPNGETSSGTW